LVTLLFSGPDPDRFLGDDDDEGEEDDGFVSADRVRLGGGDGEVAGRVDRGEGLSPISDILEATP
jgi:hypothetical protein